MSLTPQIFDRMAWYRAHARARHQRLSADFLKRHVETDIAERLSGIARPFWRRIELGPASPTLIADEEILPFAPESLDLILSLFSLHTINDLPGALIQIRRALAPDGLFIGSTFGGETLRELREALTRAESETSGGVRPRVAPMLDVRDAGGLLQRAGFALPVVDSDKLIVRYPNMMALMADLRAMGETNAMLTRPRHATRRSLFLRAAQIYQALAGDKDGRVRATFEIVTMTGWAPHASQQKPLPPGSAQTRLADALNTREESAGQKTPRSEP
jgi:SAM-dependent methyltransferase